MRKALESAGEPPLITLGQFEDMAKGCNIKTPDDRRRCMDRLSDMGELRHFSDVPGLENVVVIDPRWLADLMAKIVTANEDRMAELGMENGWTSMEALEKVVQSVCPASSSGSSWVDGLVRLMQHCGLVYAAANEMAVIPPMLPDRMTQSLQSYRAALVKQPGSQSGPLPAGPRRWWSAQYKYGRLLDHRLSRLLCRLLLLLPDVEVLDVWRFGAWLRRPQGDVLAMTCPRRLDKDYTIHVAVCAWVPELLGARVSALLGEELMSDVELKDIQYECAACFEMEPTGDAQQHGMYSANVLRKMAGRELVCEHPDGPHPVEGNPGYEIPPLDAPGASWLRTHARGLRPLMRAMELMWRHGPQEAQGQAGGSGEAGQQVGAPDVCQALLSLQVELERLEVDAEGGDDDEVAAKLDVYVSCQEARRSIEEVIKEAGADGICGGVSGHLTRVVSRSGAVMWLCTCHLSAHAW
ncbi:hypothetical protein GPECTOR_203g380 [Gonium pectorale]|uniref:COR domain-containing protein n=1 Tax=Gonium pectorale TaxID=33097 RepID=A0A150FX01_GONPE|nr:hypothetical protein GPECTOR_203g380 [Gonium pectorale]|eukprot:KXZ42108.1 hypothetical protein GPECTOR_203g380 [Gonium pectorale]